MKPLPNPGSVSRPFWEAAKKRELHIQQCETCNEYVFYPREICPECLSPKLKWVQVSGKGTLYSYTVAHVSTHPGFAGDVPYAIAIVELTEGPRMTTQIVDCPLSALRVGMPVIASFEEVNADVSLVKFRPA